MDEQAQFKVLVVEDEPGVRGVLVSTIEKFGFRTDYAEDGNQALEKIRSQNFDAILCDLRMPNRDGFQFAEEIYARGTDIPIVIVTGNNDNDSIKRVLRVGVVDYIEKPWEDDDLEKTLHRAIDEGLRRKGLLPKTSRRW